MKKVHIIVSALLFLAFLYSVGAAASEFTPDAQIIKIEQVKPGMTGYALTVLKGQTISRIPVEVISVIPRKGNPSNLILVRINNGFAAAGMSGSPV